MRFKIVITAVILLICVVRTHAQTSMVESLWADYFQFVESGSFKGIDTLVIQTEAQIAVADSLRNTQAQIDAAVLLTLVYNHQRMFQRTLELVSHLKSDVLSTIPSTDYRSAALDYLGYQASSQVTKNQDLELLAKLVDRFQGSSKPEKLLRALSNDLLGRTYYDFNNYDLAVKHLKIAQDLFAADHFNVFIGSNLTVLGVVHDALEDYQVAVAYYQQSIDHLANLENPPYGTLASNAYNIGLIYTDRYGDAFSGLPYFEQALEYDRLDGGDGNPYIADDYRMISGIYLKMRDLDRASLYINRSIEHYNRYSTPDNPGLANSHLFRASVLSAQRKHSEAAKAADEAINIYLNHQKNHNSDMRRGLALSYSNAGKIALESGDFQAATTALTKSEALSIELNRTIYLIDVYKTMIQLHLEMGSPDIALATLDKLDAVLQSKYSESVHYRNESRYLRSLIYAKYPVSDISLINLESLLDDLSQHSGMTELYLKTLALKTSYLRLDSQSSHNSASIEQHLQTLLGVMVRMQNSQSGVINKAGFNEFIKPAIVEAVGLSYEQFAMNNSKTFINLAFKFMEVNKGLSLMEGLENYRATLNVLIPKDVAAKEAQISSSLNAVIIKIQQLLESNENQSEALLAAYADQERLIISLDSLNLHIKENYPTYFALGHLDIDQDLDATKNRLMPDENVFAYIWGVEEAYVLTISQKRASLHAIDNASSRRSQIESVRSHIINRDADIDFADLASILLPDLASSTTQITIIPDDVLNGLPFEVLMLNGQYLVETFDISYQSGFRKAFESKSRRWNWAGFAPSYSTNPLPNNTLEVSTIMKIVGGSTYLGANANKDAFLMAGPSASVLHIAAHGRLNHVNPIFSKLLFGDNSENELSALEIYGMRLNALLAVLSACSSGMGAAEYGDGLMSLARAFSFAGVESTVMSLWEVPDRETAIIMEHFYQYLRDGETKHRALRLAKLKYLETTDDPYLKHPFYWAGFIISGETDAMPDSQWHLWLAAALCIALPGMWYYRQKMKTAA